jgi:hypothetical protein
MRLNGKREILSYLGRHTQNKKTWRRIRTRYEAVIWCEPTSGHLWALSEDLDAVDRARCVPMTEFLKRGPKGEHAGGGAGSWELLKLSQ